MSIQRFFPVLSSQGQGLRHCHQSAIASASASSIIFAGHDFRSRSRIITQFSLQQGNSLFTRSMATIRQKKETNQGKLLDMQVVDPYIPPTKYKNRGQLWTRIKKAFVATISVAMIKYSTKVNFGMLGSKFEGMYIEMNETLFNGGEGGVTRLYNICTDGMIAKLRQETKIAKKMGNRVVWKSHGQASRPSLLHVVQVKAELPTGTTRIAQIIVKVHVNQSLAIYEGNTNKLVGGDPEKIVGLVEYLVMEKWLDAPEDDWKIKCKLVPSST